MENYGKYVQAFMKGLELDSEEGITALEYQSIVQWDSVGHMGLVAEIEDTFEIEMETDDIIDFNSFVKGIELLKKYGIEITI